MSNINKIKVSGQTYSIQDENAALASDVFITANNRNSIQSRINEGIYSLSTDDVYTIVGTKANATDVIKGLIIVDNVKYNFTGSTSSDVQGVSDLDGIVTFDLASPFSISLVDRDTNHINELFIETFTADGEESPMSNIVITHNPTVGVNKIDYVSTLYTEFVHEKYALADVVEQTKQDTLVSGTNIKTINNQSILGSGNITIQGGGASVIEVTQAEYDALVEAGTLDLTALYIITDATAGDLSNYYTKTETSGATQISTALASKQDTLVSGTNIKTINSQSLLGEGNITIEGGGASYQAGTNISIDNDTINCTLPIREGSNSSGKGIIIGDSECSASGIYSISIGHNSDANGTYSFCNGSNSNANGQMSFVYGDFCHGSYDNSFLVGRSITATKPYQFIAGQYLHPKNDLEVNFGTYNNSVSASTTFGHSGNTMFSIGNGYDFSSTHNWHNAFEVRQNGDIYVPNTDDTSVTGDKAYSLYPMVRLQDTITATAANTTALGGLKLVKLTQSEYDALSTKDSNTLYVIVN